MISAPDQQRSSAQVDLYLLIGAEKHELAQVGPDFVIFARASSLAPDAHGELVVTVNGSDFRAAIKLPKGASASVRKTPFSVVE